MSLLALAVWFFLPLIVLVGGEKLLSLPTWEVFDYVNGKTVSRTRFKTLARYRASRGFPVLDYAREGEGW